MEGLGMEDHEKVDDSRKVDERKSKEQDYHIPLCGLSGCVLYNRISVHTILLLRLCHSALRKNSFPSLPAKG